MSSDSFTVLPISSSEYSSGSARHSSAFSGMRPDLSSMRFIFSGMLCAIMMRLSSSGVLKRKSAPTAPSASVTPESSSTAARSSSVSPRVETRRKS